MKAAPAVGSTSFLLKIFSDSSLNVWTKVEPTFIHGLSGAEAVK
jgi:hypothetical protein